MKRYYARIRASAVKHRVCFICGDLRHADLALDFGKAKLHVAKACLEALGVVVSPIGDEALRTFAGTVLGNLASAALGDTFGPQLKQVGALLLGAKTLVEKNVKTDDGSGSKRNQVIDVEYEVVAEEKKP